MDRVKLYSGSISEDTATKTVKQYYGGTSSPTAKKSKTELLNNKLLEFLVECGADAKYDGLFLWINGVPVTFYFTGSNSYFTCYFPFSSTALFSNTTYTTVFSGMNYNFKLRLLGEPTTAFILFISSNYASPGFSSNGFIVAFYKAENILSKRNARMYGKTTTSNHQLASFDLDSEGIPIDIGRSGMINTVYKLNTYAVDFTNNRNKYPLTEWMPDIFKVNGCYYNLQNDPLPQAAGAAADAQTFIKMGGYVYFRSIYGPFIKCVT